MKEKTRRSGVTALLAVIAAIAMVFTLMVGSGVTAFAANTSTDDAGKGSITVENAVSGSTYTAYKIFDVTYDKNKTPAAYSYTIDSTSAWYNAVKSYADTAANGMTLTQIGSSTTYNVTTSSTFSAPAFAQYLNGKVTGATPEVTDSNAKTLTQSGATASVSSLDLGYWFVTTTTGSLCNLTTSNPNAEIYDKNDVTFTKTDNTNGSVEVGQTVTYTLTGKVPSTTGYKSYVYKVSDIMSDGLTFNGDVEVKFGNITVYKRTSEGTETTDTFDATYSSSVDRTVKNVNTKATSNCFTIQFDMAKEAIQNTYVNQAITITYTAKVNSNAITHDEENNKAVLEYSNDPTDSTKTTPTEEKDTHTYSFNVVIDKYEKDTTSKKLAGATFALYKYDTDTTTKLYYKQDSSTKEVSWVKDLTKDGSASTVKEADNITRVTTDDKGAGEFDGLKAGTYYLVETAAPDGYNKLTADIPVVITVKAQSEETEPYSISATVDSQTATVAHKVDNQITNADDDGTYDNDVTASIANNTGSLLPSTGGIGTTIFYVIGGCLVAAAAVILIARKRRRA